VETSTRSIVSAVGIVIVSVGDVSPGADAHIGVVVIPPAALSALAIGTTVEPTVVERSTLPGPFADDSVDDAVAVTPLASRRSGPKLSAGWTPSVTLSGTVR
jgi:hypothetical protein